MVLCVERMSNEKMAAPVQRDVCLIAVRGSQGVTLANGPPNFEENNAFPGSDSQSCRVMTFSKDGNYFAYCDGVCVRVVSVNDNRVIGEIPKPRTVGLLFSPQNNLLATWEAYAVTKDQPAGTPNLHIWDLRTGQPVKGFIQKKQHGWSPQWSIDEGICSRNVNNEIHFFENNNFDTITNKLHLQKVAEYSLPPRACPPYHVAAYVPGAKGQPSFVRVYKYPNFASALANKSFYKADTVELIWNNKGSALLVLAATDTSADSYYGEQGLHYVGIDGESCLVPRAKNGPVYNVEWNPNSLEFCVVYGFMPAKATLYNLKCEPVFDFGTGPRNMCYFNPHGNMLCLAGFGNLRGNMEFWDLKKKSKVSNPIAADSTYFQWCPDGIHVLTSTTSPRLRVGNGYKVWRYTGEVLIEKPAEKGIELWDTCWQPALEGVFPEPRIVSKGGQQTSAAPSGGPLDGIPSVYVPPALRGNPELAQNRPRFRTEYEPASNMKQDPDKPGQKSRRRKGKGKQEQQDDSASSEVAPPTQAAPVETPSTGDPEKDKKIRNLKKKLQAIEKLKEQQASGKQLEINQMEKIKTEAALIEEIQKLQL